MKDKKQFSSINPVDLILDENNNDNITLFDEDKNPIEFEQIALIPLERTDALYAILIPLSPMQGVNPGEGVLFEVDEVKKDVSVVRDQQIIDEVLEIYQALVDAGEDEDE